MQTYCVVNKKGGSGKTTTALALVDYLRNAGKQVLAVDLDPQGNMSSVLQNDERMMGAAELFADEVPEDIADVIQEPFDTIGLIAGGGRLIDAERNLNNMITREVKLKEGLEPLRNKYDYCVIDTPPSVGNLTANALVASDKAIIAASADAFSADGFVALHRDIVALRKYLNPALAIDGILLTRFSDRTVLGREMHKEFRALAEQIGTRVYKAKIRENISLREAQYARQLISDYDKSCSAIQDYSMFVKELLGGEI